MSRSIKGYESGTYGTVLYPLDAANAEVRLPSVILGQRIVVRIEVTWRIVLHEDAVEHTAKSEADCGLGDAARSEEKRARTEQQSVSGREVWGPSPGAADNKASGRISNGGVNHDLIEGRCEPPLIVFLQ